MNAPRVPLIVHVGYPKTATTTFQKHIFPHHPEIEYLGKLIPSFRYVDEQLYELVDDLLHRSNLWRQNSDQLREKVESVRRKTGRKCVLISSESFIHPSVGDVGAVADRLYEALGACKILITIREQAAAILSFYWMHGRFGEYLTIGAKSEEEQIRYPIPFSDWIRFQMRVIDRNYIGTLRYHEIIAHYTRRFGPENVCVLLFEMLQADRDKYAKELAKFLDVDLAALRGLMAGKHEYQSTGMSAPRSNLHAAAIGHGSKPTNKFAKFLALLGGRPDKGSDEQLAADIANLQGMYRRGNAQLAREKMLPLEQFGYSV